MAKEKPKSEPKPERSLAVSQPFKGFQEMRRHFGDIFGRSFLTAPWRGFTSGEMTWAPAIHVAEKADRFVIKVELPGVKEEDITVSVTGDVLTIEGEKEADSEVKKKGYYYSETSCGSFSRSVTLPSTVNASKIVASYDKGVLELDLPKSAQVKAKQIKVTARKKQETISKKKEKSAGKKDESSNKQG